MWLGKVEAIELELVSTMALEKILKTEGGKTEAKSRSSQPDGRTASCAGHGDRSLPDSERFRSQEGGTRGRRAEAPPEVTAAPLTETTRKKADELSLVSTQNCGRS